MPAPHWFFRFMYDRESAALAQRHDDPQHRELIERTAEQIGLVVPTPGPIADLGCGPGLYALALARRGYDVVGIDGSPRMVEIGRQRAARESVAVSFEVDNISEPLRFADGSLGGVLAILVIQHLPDPEAFLDEVRRCLRPGGFVLIVAPTGNSKSLMYRSLYWRMRSAFYRLVPGLVRFDDADSLARLVESQRLTVVESDSEPSRVSVLATAGT